MISRTDGVDARGRLAAAGGSLTVTVGNVTQSLGSGNGGLTTSFSSLGPAPISLRLKPDVSAPGEGVLSTVPGGYAIWDGTSMASPAVAGAAALLRQRHPQWTPAGHPLGARADARTRPTTTRRRTVEALPLAVGSGLIDVTAADTTPLLSPQASANFGLAARAGVAARCRSSCATPAAGAGSWTVSAPGLGAPPSDRRARRRARSSCR